VILVDVGNTSIHFALAKNGEIAKTWAVDTASVTLAGIRKAVGAVVECRAPLDTSRRRRDTRGARCIETPAQNKIIVCSVVPRITKLFKQIPGTLIVGKDIHVPIKCRYNKKQVGQDRLVAAYAAKKLYPNARIVIDFGTAITFDILSERGDYEGGIILPGIGSTMRTLANCAMLPKHMRLRHVKTLIPRNTEDSINKGIDSGFEAMLNQLISDYRKKLKILKTRSIIVTGGEGFFIARRLKHECIFDPMLVIKGLALLHD
jgi:type III pantothenate kinase